VIIPSIIFSVVKKFKKETDLSTRNSFGPICIPDAWRDSSRQEETWMSIEE
jgi:hypothetical protein